MAAVSEDPIVIVAAKRTALGGFQGALKDLVAPEIGAAAIAAAVEQAKVPPAEISEVLMGCVLPAGQGQAPARQAALAAGLPEHVPCTTLNKMCGSAMKTVMMANEALYARPDDVMVAGGMESMSNAPYLLPKMRSGARLGHGQVIDHMFLDGLEDAYDKGRLMGTFAEDTAEHYQFTRQAQDEFAIESLKRAKITSENGGFDDEIVKITVKTRKGDAEVTQDEQPFAAQPDRIPSLKPAFRKGGTVTAANSSSISDGAAVLVLMRASQAKKRSIKPIAKIVGQTTHAQAPAWFSTAPIGAMQKLFEQTGWAASEVGLYEINEAFAVVTMASMRDLELPHDKVNVHGGACALGHPIGASGARIIVTLLHAMRERGQERGVASMCIGGGEATAMAFELMN